MQDQIENLPKRAQDKQKANKRFFTKLRKKPPKHLDYLMQEIHQAEFQKTNCLDCANCCKTTGPLLTDKDVSRIAKHLKLKDQKFIESYVRVDEDGDFVLQSLPCVFLGHDNCCSIYDVRPKACREYPHTNQR